MINAMMQAPSYHRVESIRALKINSVRNGRFITVVLNGKEVELDAIDLVVAGNTITSGQIVYICDGDNSIKLHDLEHLDKFTLTL